MPTQFSDGVKNSWNDSVSMSMEATLLGKLMDRPLGNNAQEIANSFKDVAGSAMQGSARSLLLQGAQMFNYGDQASVLMQEIQNPRLAQSFKGSGFRSFSFDYVMAPRNEAEARTVAQILVMLRLSAYPEAVGQNSTLTWTLKYPRELEIEFFDSNGNAYQGVDKTLPKILPCVINSVDITYSADGGAHWAALRDDPKKSPTHIRLRLTVTETRVLTRQDVALGY